MASLNKKVEEDEASPTQVNYVKGVVENGMNEDLLKVWIPKNNSEIVPPKAVEQIQQTITTIEDPNKDVLSVETYDKASEILGLSRNLWRKNYSKKV